MEFYSTLAGVMVTLLAILAASVGAYAVFLKERAATLDEQVVQDQIKVRDTLIQIHSAPVWGLSFYLGPEFGDAYRSRISAKAGPAFIFQAAVDITFRNTPMQQALNDVTPRFSSLDDGRVYFGVVKEAVHTLTGALDVQVKAVEAFPNAASGPGFDEWRSDFQRTRPALAMLSALEQEMLTNLQSFEAHLPRNEQHNTSSYVAQEVTRFFDRIEEMDKALADIDKQQILKKPYMGRVTWSWILLLSALAFLLGIVVPLFLLAWNVRMNSVGATAILLAALALTLGAIGVFARDVMRKENHDYLTARWVEPLSSALETAAWSVQRAGLLDTNFFLEAQSSLNELLKHPTPVSEALRNLITAGNLYNEKAMVWNKTMMAALRANPTLAQSSSQCVPGGGSKFPPIEIFSEERLAVIMKWAESNPNACLDIEPETTPHSPQPGLMIPLQDFSKDPSKLLDAFRSVRNPLMNSPEKQAFEAAQTQLQTALKQLKSALTSAARI